MTVHAAAVYFDDSRKCSGIVLAADRRVIVDAGYVELAQPARATGSILYQPKSFFGERSVGFCSGRFLGNEDGLRVGCRSLDYLFDSLPDGKEFLENKFLVDAASYCLSVVVRDEKEISLFSVIGPTVQLVARVTDETYNNVGRTTYWKSLHDARDYGREEGTRRVPPAQAKLLVTHLLWKASPQEEDERDFYFVDRDGIRPL